jgi:hypothetical protein
LVLLLLAGAACGTEGAQAGAPAPLELPMPPGPEGTAPATSGGGSATGGLAAKLTPAATPEYLKQVGEMTRKLATGRVRMVAAANGGKNNPMGVTELTALEGRWDNGARSSLLHLDPTGAIKAGITSFVRFMGGPVDMIQIGDVRYLRMGGARTWTKTEGGNALGPIFSLFQIDDVGGFLGALGCAGPVTMVGTEQLEGVDTHHFRVEAPSARIKSCSSGNSEAGGLLNYLGDSERAQVDVWVDEGSLVRRLVTTSDEKALGEGLDKKFPGATSTMTMNLTGFGEPAGIVAPPAGEVDDDLGLGGLDDLLGGLGEGGDGTGGLDLGDILSELE